MIKKLFYGTTICSLKQIEDYWSLKTSVAVAAIYNPINIYYNNPKDSGKVLKKDIVGHTIINEEFSPEESYDLILDNYVKISISLVPEDYTGPEALVVSFSTGEIVVVN